MARGVGSVSRTRTLSLQVADTPRLFVTVSCTAYAPSRAYVCTVVGCTPFAPSANVHAHRTTPSASVDVRPSNVHARRTQAITACALGGATNVPGGDPGVDAPPDPLGRYTRRLGVAFVPLTTPVVAPETSAADTCAGVASGNCSRYSAAIPATYGEASDVPLDTRYPSSAPMLAAGTLSPGA